MKKLLLIDGSNLIFRSYYATAAMGNLMQNSNGIYTNGIYGLVNSMQAIQKMDFTHLLVALDPIGKTLRHELFEEYKGQRKETPSELVMQFPLMTEYFDSAGIPYYRQELYEADDIIGYAATHFKTEFDEITIISNDHDLMQLLDTNVRQMVSKKGFSEVEIFTPSYMKEKLGITPDQIPDYKGLVGDASDNIPGIKGIGDKTAVKLLEEYATLENVLNHSDDLKGKLKERIEEGKDIARFSKKLATIETDFDNQLDIDHCIYEGYTYDKLLAFYQKMEFHQFIKRLVRPKMEVKPVSESSIKEMKNPNDFEVFFKQPLSIELEIFGSNYHNATYLGFALASKTETYYIDFQTALNSSVFKAWLQSSEVKYTFDAKMIEVILLKNNLSIANVSFDLLLAAYVINPNLTKEDFKVIVSSFDYYDVMYDEEVYAKGAKYSVPEDFNIVKQHAIKKARAIYDLRETLLKQLVENEQLELLKEVEIPLTFCLADMEATGIKVDQDKLIEIGEDLKSRISELEQYIYDLAGEEFNINSPKQLGVILFETLALPYSKKTKSGYSTDVSVLKQLEAFHPIISAIMDYRTLTKLYSTYYEGLKSALTIVGDGRIHTIYKQALTQTGRLSSVEPNLQNIPIRTEEGKELRKVFVTEKDYELYSCDYSQIELRVLAHMGNVTHLKEAFLAGEDIHTATAKLIFKKDSISSLERRQAKAINFGIIYGKTAWGLSEDLKISPKQAERFIKDYFANYPEIKVFMDAQIEAAKNLGYVKTILNRRRYIPEVSSNQYQTREFGKRMAMNAPIQGSAADILKVAMVKLFKQMKEQKLKSKMLLQIHDEVVFLVHTSEHDLVASLVKETMEHAIKFSVPLTMESSFGENLYEVK